VLRLFCPAASSAAYAFMQLFCHAFVQLFCLVTSANAFEKLFRLVSFASYAFEQLLRLVAFAGRDVETVLSHCFLLWS
jgi:hypothetical protein